MESVIQVQGLVKSLGKFRVLNGLDLSVARGEVHGFLGPTFRLRDWALGISPLYHVPNVTTPTPDYTGLAAVAVIAVAFLVVGFVGFRRRDVL